MKKTKGAIAFEVWNAKRGRYVWAGRTYTIADAIAATDWTRKVVRVKTWYDRSQRARVVQLISGVETPHFEERQRLKGLIRGFRLYIAANRQTKRRGTRPLFHDGKIAAYEIAIRDVQTALIKLRRP